MKYDLPFLFGYFKPDLYYPGWVVFTLNIATEDK